MLTSIHVYMDWKENDYQKLVRIKKDQLDWLRKHKKQKQSIAAFLDEIINYIREQEK